MKFAWQATVQDESGNAVPLPVVTVYLNDGVTLASIYAEDEVTPLDNPMTGTLEGFVQFWADAGNYRIEGSDGSETTQIWVVILGDPFIHRDLAALTAFLTANGPQGDGTIYSTLAEGFTYKEQAVSPTVTFGGVGLVQSDDVTDATAVGAPNTGDPSGRAAYMPALVDSVQQRKLNGVSTRYILGQNYNPSSDAAVALNAAFADLAPEGIAVNNPHHIVALCEEPIIAQKNLLLDSLRLVRGFAGGAMFTLDTSGNARVAVTVTSAAGAVVVITAVGLGAQVGEEILLTRFDRASGLQSKWVEITAKSGDSYTLDAIWPSGVTVSNGYAARINRTDGLMLREVIFSTASPSQTGRVVGLTGHDMFFDRVRVESAYRAGTGGDGAFYLGGDRIRMLMPWVRIGAGAGMDGIRIGVGNDFMCMGADVVSGDDCFAISPYTSPTSITYDVDVDNAKFIGCRGVSTIARVFFAGVVNGEEQMYCRVKDFLLQGISGYALTSRAFTIENSYSSQPTTGALRDVSLQCDRFVTAQAQAAFVGNVTNLDAVSGGVGKLSITGLKLLNNTTSYGLDIQDGAGAVELDLSGGYDLSGVLAPMRVSNAKHLALRDGSLRSGSAEILIGAGGTVEDLLIDGAEVDNITTNKAGIQLVNVTQSDVRRLTARKASGASDTSAVRIGSGKTSDVGRILGDTDSQVSGSGRAFRKETVGEGAPVTISAGVITLGDGSAFAVSTEGGAGTDDLVTINYPAWWPNGKIITLRRRDTNTTVIKDGTGNVFTAGDFSLTSNGDRIMLQVRDGTLAEVSRTDN